MRRMLLGLPVTLLIAVYLPASEPSNQEWDNIAWINEVLKGPERHLDNYDFTPLSSILSRVRDPNPHFLAYLQSVEEQAHPAEAPSEEEIRCIGDALNLLPPLHKRIIQDRVIEISLIENLGSSGWTDWVVSENGDLYCVVALDRKTLSMDLGKWLESRENTCFGDVSEGIEIEIDAGSKYSGLFGILLHEMTHVVDYVINITPFVEPSTYELAQKQQKKLRDNYPFVEGIWDGIYAPSALYNYALRDSVTFYRPTNDRKLMSSDAAAIYDQLSATPFSSLLGSKNWADDLAEIAMFYHLTHILLQPYTISVMKDGNVIYSYKPMQNQMVIERFPTMEMFYHTD